MASEIAIAVISSGTGLFAGLVGSLIAPWVNWGVEKRRLRRARGVQRIEEWRQSAYQLGSDVSRVLFRLVAVGAICVWHEMALVSGPLELLVSLSVFVSGYAHVFRYRGISQNRLRYSIECFD